MTSQLELNPPLELYPAYRALARVINTWPRPARVLALGLASEPLGRLAPRADILSSSNQALIGQERLPWEDEAFDLVLALDTPLYLDLAVLLPEMVRLARFQAALALPLAQAGTALAALAEVSAGNESPLPPPAHRELARFFRQRGIPFRVWPCGSRSAALAAALVSKAGQDPKTRLLQVINQELSQGVKPARAMRNLYLAHLRSLAKEPCPGWPTVAEPSLRAQDASAGPDGNHLHKGTPPHGRRRQPSLVIQGPLWHTGGEGESMRLLALHLAQGDAVQLALKPSPGNGVALEADQRKRLAALELQGAAPAEAPWLSIGPPQDWAPRSQGPLVAYTAFDPAIDQDTWLKACAEVDQVWLTSSSGVEALASLGVPKGKLRLVLPPLPGDDHAPDLLPLELNKEQGHFVFLCVLDWLERKGWDVLLEAYLGEFDFHEPVSLYLKVFSSEGLAPEVVHSQVATLIQDRLGLSLPHIPTVTLLNARLTPQQMARLYCAADAYVLPGRAEGWGRSLLEAASCARPIITTPWGPAGDLLAASSYLVAFRPSGGSWGEPDLQSLKQALRQCFAQPREAQERGRAGRQALRNSSRPGQAVDVREGVNLLARGQVL